MLENISILDVDNFNNVEIIDIRNNNLYEKDHIMGAINIPFEKILLNPNMYLNKNLKYYIYCQKGLSSRNVALELSRLGYNVVNLQGGYELYKKHK